MKEVETDQAIEEPTEVMHINQAVSHDEFRGPRSDFLRQVALVTTTTEKHQILSEHKAMAKSPDLQWYHCTELN
ncbi:hypothetical protein TNCV_4988551 [Trichonephila clavipes]|nr:hypothetical protein TNCV_4988551 [Trichonephila clavipes]